MKSSLGDSLGARTQDPNIKSVVTLKRQKASPAARFLTQPAELANLIVSFASFALSLVKPLFSYGLHSGLHKTMLFEENMHS